ncbi:MULTISPECIES: hypothetical protein [unclassified Paenibacillus]|uniref:hypothetical protein n=1 Tax=unclassified Paenibacillus TaxID=185978 RepID=UPI0015BFBC74|nr:MULTISPECIES: hypothetical protein [unclassified Paenibacillus]
MFTKNSCAFKRSQLFSSNSLAELVFQNRSGVQPPCKLCRFQPNHWIMPAAVHPAESLD